MDWQAARDTLLRDLVSHQHLGLVTDLDGTISTIAFRVVNRAATRGAASFSVLLPEGWNLISAVDRLDMAGRAAEVHRELAHSASRQRRQDLAVSDQPGHPSLTR